MDEGKQPETKTPAGFCQLVMEEIMRRRVTLTLTEAARELRIAPDALRLVFNGSFPGKPKNPKKPPNTKFIQGRVASVTSICTKLGLDVKSCLEACELPYNERVIERRLQQIAKKSVPLGSLDKPELEMLLAQAAMLGPLPWELIIQLVERFHKNQKLQSRD